MATSVTFNNMLKKYMPYNLLFEEVTKRDYFLNKINKDETWMNGELQVPFMGGSASSISFGQLTAEADITEDRPVLGIVSSYKELWGAMIFNDRDLSQHGSMEKSFLKILPDRLENFVGNMKEGASVALLNGSHILTLDVAAPATNLVGGIVVVDRPARVNVGQYLEFGIVSTLRTAGYVSAVNIENKTISIVLNKDLSGGAVDLAAAGVVAGDKAFYRGGTVATETFTSLRNQLLAAANGGSATLFGISKLLYPYLQAPNFDGSGITASNVLDKIFDFWVDSRVLGKGMPTEAVMSYKHLGSAMKQLEGGLGGAGKGRQYTKSDVRASAFGWTEIDVVGPKGKLTLVGVQEMDDDIIYMLDWRALKLHSNGFFERRTSPDGKQFFEIRSTTGYKYVVDTRFYGELVVSAPSHCGIIHSIP